MEVTGKIILALPEASGTSKSGNPWKKREYVLETLESFPKKIFFDFFGDKADQYPLTQGETYRISFDISSREYQGRWYTSISAWKAEPAQATPAGGQAFPDARTAPGYNQPAPGFSAPASQPYFPSAPAAESAPTPPAPLEASNDDLPF
jgi:hypothetical protein